MELWLVQDVPAWLVAVLLMIGLPILMLALDVLIHRTLPHHRLGRHNDVTGVIILVVGVAYGVVIGLCVISLWERYDEARDTVREEATALTALVPGGSVFDEQTRLRISEAVVRYLAGRVGDWNTRLGAGTVPATVTDPATRTEPATTTSPAAATGPTTATAPAATTGPVPAAGLDELTGIIGGLRPTTEAQRSYIEDAVATVGRAEHYRHDLTVEVGEQHMSPIMWLGVLVSTAAILVMCLFFGLDDALLRRLLLTMSTAVIATNLYLVIEMNYPYYGAFAVTPEAYRDVIAQVRSHP